MLIIVLCLNVSFLWGSILFVIKDNIAILYRWENSDKRTVSSHEFRHFLVPFPNSFQSPQKGLSCFFFYQEYFKSMEVSKIRIFSQLLNLTNEKNTQSFHTLLKFHNLWFLLEISTVVEILFSALTKIWFNVIQFIRNIGNILGGSSLYYGGIPNHPYRGQKVVG